ncbi:MAG: hypothetical protein L3J35_11370 [Bacteroidales bacterium]|nr:hypothetical protein [Bacteroidales bacterium]
MGNSQELLKQINWFIEPVSDFILWLFTSTTGYILMLIFLILYFLFSVINAFRVRKLAHEAISRNLRIPFPEKIYLFFSEIIKVFMGIVSKLPVLLGVFLILFGIVGLSTALSTVDDFIENQKRIAEMKTVVKNLDKSYIVAKMEIVDMNYVENKTSLKIYFYDYELDDYLPETQDIEIKGKDIYFLNYVMNFNYSEIASGKKVNLVMPYKIFSEEVSKDDGILLQTTDSVGVPYIFHRDDDEIYGIEKGNYYARLKEFAELMTDSEKARKEGIKSFYAAAPHFVNNIRKGQKIIIWSEQTGGLVLKKERLF